MVVMMAFMPIRVFSFENVSTKKRPQFRRLCCPADSKLRTSLTLFRGLFVVLFYRFHTTYLRSRLVLTLLVMMGGAREGPGMRSRLTACTRSVLAGTTSSLSAPLAADMLLAVTSQRHVTPAPRDTHVVRYR